MAGEKRPEPPAPADQGAIVVVVDAVVVVGAAVVVVVGGAVVVVVVAGSRAIQISTVLPIFTSTPAAGILIDAQARLEVGRLLGRPPWP